MEGFACGYPERYQVPFNFYHRTFRKAMAQILKRVQPYEPDSYNKLCHLRRKQKGCHYWCRINLHQYFLLKEKDRIF